MRADKGGEDSKERRVYTQLPRVCVCVCVCVCMCARTHVYVGGQGLYCTSCREGSRAWEEEKVWGPLET